MMSRGRRWRRSRLLALCAALSLGLMGTFGVVASMSTSALAKNAGDTWVDNVGQPAGPGHEMDPHLACTDINLWGNGMTDSSGSYTIDSWSPSGHHEQVYSGTWNYNTAQGGDQIMDVIHVATLIANAKANGDAPVNKQGFHFKLELSQGPQKTKTFWVNCTGTSTVASPALATNAVSGTFPGTIHDVAHLTGGISPTGTITWNVYASSDSSCSNPLNAQPSTLTAPVNGSGEYTSPNYTPSGTGSYQWVATYSGDANNAPASTACGDPNEVSQVSSSAVPGIALFKTERIGSASFTHGPITGNVGDTVDYQIAVLNTGNTTLVITFTDSQCDGGTPSGPTTVLSGTYDPGTRTLSAGGELLYTCTHVLAAGDQPYTNTASASGLPPSGPAVSATDSVQAYANTPGIQVVKLQRDGTSGPFTSSQITANSGDTIYYEIQVLNTGNVPLTLSLNDPRCDAGTVQGPVATSGTLSGNTLSAGGAAQYTCSHHYLQGDPTPFTNVATVTGTPPSGPTVTGTGTVTLTRTSVAAKHVCRSVRTGKVISYKGKRKPAACLSRRRTHHRRTHHHRVRAKHVCRSLRTGKVIHYRGSRKPAACRPNRPHRGNRGFTG
jgi:plastocyanin